MKQVRDTSAAQQITAYIILRNDRAKTEVATVHVYFAKSGGVSVNIFNYGKRNPQGLEDPQYSNAGGYGYDKETAALSGLKIDGYILTDHCGGRLRPPKGAKSWPHGSKCRKGYSFANYSSELSGWTDCYRQPGLKYLSEIGYRVIRAI